MSAKEPTRSRGSRSGRDAMETFSLRKRSLGVDWRDVDETVLRAVLGVVIAADVALMFSPAQGGAGVCVTIYEDRKRAKEYVNNSTELVELLEAIVERYSSDAEDPYAVYRKTSD